MVEIYNLLGERVLKLHPKNRAITVVADQLESGIYLAKISTDSGTGTIKLIKN